MLSMCRLTVHLILLRIRRKAPQEVFSALFSEQAFLIGAEQLPHPSRAAASPEPGNFLIGAEESLSTGNKKNAWKNLTPFVV